jgi:F0F1-type ATP synthase assembly protein I
VADAVTDQSTTDRDHVTEPLQADKSLGELISELTSDLGHLFRQEVQLAKTEAREEVKQVGKGAGMLAGAGLSAWLSLVMLSLTLAWLLDKELDRAVSFLIVGLLWAVVGAVLAVVGKKQVALARPLPETVQTLKEDAQWVKAQKS